MLHPLTQDLTLVFEERETLADGVIALHGQLNVAPDVPQRHARLLQTSDDLQPLEVLLLKHPHAARGALHERQQPLLIIIAQRGGRNLQHLRHLAHGIDYCASSL